MTKTMQPAEWELHQAVWLAWPSHENLWQEDLPDAQKEFTALCTAIADPDPVTGKPRGEKLEILVPDAAREEDARKALGKLNPRFHRIPFGDIWLRDTAPIFMDDAQGRLLPVRFRFNGWGEKYVLPFDVEVSAAIANAAGEPEAPAYPWVLEGGSVEVDGEGTCLTTRQCLLNPNRNPNMTEAQIEAGLREALGVSQVLWLGDGMLNDHTDGHVDTIARFVAPGVVMCMEARDDDDPNREVFEQIARDLAGMTDARGRKLKVVRVPSPGKILNWEDEIMPASYVNFYIGNTAVVVPTYGSRHDADAVKTIGEYFPGRTTVGLSAKAILTGGGAFHCITQQQPLAQNERTQKK